jgi:hypothetical protein
MDVSEYHFGDDEIAKLHDSRDNQPDVRFCYRTHCLRLEQCKSSAIGNFGNGIGNPRTAR